MIGVIIGVFVGGVLGVAVMCLLRMAKPTDIDSGLEPSLAQEDRFVVLENVEEIEENKENFERTE